jgi:predicted metalloprotease with PDZ domain
MRPSGAYFAFLIDMILPPRPARYSLRPILLALFASAMSCSALAQSPADLPLPQRAAATPTLPKAMDRPYPGVIKLSVDATDLNRRIFQVRETIPVSGPGPVTLLYPQWLPGHHSPRGPIDKMAGLTITVDGKPVSWTRDPVNVYAFHVDVPAGAKGLEASFQFLSPTASDQGRVVMTQEMLNLQWNTVALYPAGYAVSRIMVEPSVTLPSGWSKATALDIAATTGDTTRYQPVNLETLIDSPMFAGQYYRQIDLDPGGRSPVRLNIFADKASELPTDQVQIDAHKALLAQADKLYGARHFNHYDFLFAITDVMGGIGLEHHRSSENGVGLGYFTEWDKNPDDRDLLPHEFTHSWDGKFRRPADLWTADYSEPMRNSLLWVYEGQTQYWGYVLAARSGLLSRQEALDAIAQTAAVYDARIGRNWRDLQDTVNDPIISARTPQPWRSWQRSEDYYSEGQLVWLEIDTMLREKTGGKKSLDDFAKAFYGVQDGVYAPATYTFEDVVNTLNSVMPYDWATLLKTRLSEHAKGAPLKGLATGGYRLVYLDKPSDYDKASAANRKITDLTYSLGLIVNRDGRLTSVLWNGKAYQQGLAVGMSVLAVNGRTFDGDRLKEAITAARTAKDPISLIIRDGDHFRTVQIDYHDGLRYPHLQRIEGTADRLGDILAARK